MSFSSVLLWKRNEHRTGASVTAMISAPKIAKAYVFAIGPNRAPSGPDMAKSGRKAQTMIVVEKKRGRSISCEASAIRSISGLDRSAPREVTWRKMFSTMMTELSTMIPKSTAPIESRLADFPWK